jgi:hypothetical protein
MHVFTTQQMMRRCLPYFCLMGAFYDLGSKRLNAYFLLINCFFGAFLGDCHYFFLELLGLVSLFSHLRISLGLFDYCLVLDAYRSLEVGFGFGIGHLYLFQLNCLPYFRFESDCRLPSLRYFAPVIPRTR